MQNTHLKTESAGVESDLYVIPFQLGTELVIKSISNPALKAKATVYGSVPGRMIIIEEPLFCLTERFEGLSEGFICAYMHGDHLLKFKSKFIKRLFQNVIGIDYPKDVERIQVRSSTRIRVNIETQVILNIEDGTISGCIADISKGGCRLELPKLIDTRRGSKVHLRFTLPDNQSIDNLACAVMNVKHLNDNTILGVSFSGPAQAIMKVERFCELCATALALEARQDNFS
ncbi:MAG: PilZ domain-containing protein [Syntrophobacteraceae bacterium]|jgi:c-di-GMP-binding flagellar brake protein YcgR